MYFVETFIPPKRRSSLQNIQENFKSTYESVTNYYAQNDYMTTSVMIINKFYQMYYYNNVQDDINDLVFDALKKTSTLTWEKSA
ncbi:MAG: hypothetical protein LBQ59_03485 [Candidatus Peribacteria bacterium]|nr:hypothetical protein [Candidatus Peribacteria bacterium]